jgi:hypothetical protein
MKLRSGMEYNINIVKKPNGGITNEFFGVGEQEYTVELGEELSINDFDFNEIIADAMETHDLADYDLGKIEIIAGDQQLFHDEVAE